MSSANERRKEAAAERIRRKASQHNAGQKSRYARKKAWLVRSPHTFGFEVHFPKPWGGGDQRPRRMRLKPANAVVVVNYPVNNPPDTVR